MKVNRLLPVLALMTVALTGCEVKDTAAREQIAALTTRLVAKTKELDDLYTWLGKSPQNVQRPTKTVDQWHQQVYKAICSLEQKANPPAADRLCHEHNTDHGAPPNPPPFL